MEEMVAKEVWKTETACKGNCGGERLESEAKKGNGRVRRGNQKRKGRTVRNRLLLPVLARALIRRTRLRLSPSSRARQAASEPVGRQPPPVRRRWGLEVVIAAVPLLQPHNHGDRADVAFPDGSLVQMHACRRAAAVAGVVCSPSCLFCIFFFKDSLGPPNAGPGNPSLAWCRHKGLLPMTLLHAGTIADDDGRSGQSMAFTNKRERINHAWIHWNTEHQAQNPCSRTSPHGHTTYSQEQEVRRISKQHKNSRREEENVQAWADELTYMIGFFCHMVHQFLFKDN